MQLYFVRHGQSYNNALWDRARDSTDRKEDPELTDYGRRQAQIVARFLAEHNGPPPTTGDAGVQNIDTFGLTHLYTSLMIRSMDTANAIAQVLNLTPVVWEDLHETGGIFLDDKETGERIGLPGKNRSYFEENYPDFILPDHLNEEGWWNRPFEPHDERVLRALRLRETLQERHGDSQDRVAVVSHGGFYNYFLAAVLQIPILSPSSFWFSLNNIAITRIDFEEGRTRIAYNNRVDFLPPALVT
jgi:2,3-bisphosphoglycerate-dependent phosphoglycerate mutase